MMYASGGRYLFSKDPDLINLVSAWKQDVNSSIDKLSDEQIANVDETRLIEIVKEQFQKIVPTLLEEQISIEAERTQIDISNIPSRIPFGLFPNQSPFVEGQKVSVYVPFEGDSSLFTHRTRSMLMVPCQGRVQNKELVLEFSDTNMNSETLKREIAGALKQIKSQLDWVRNDVLPFNDSIPQIIQSALKHRRTKLSERTNLLENLELPIRRRSAPAAIEVPDVRRKIAPKLTDAVQELDPGLSLEIYDHILKVCSDMTKVLELSPEAFSHLEEEHLRFMFLVNLNGHYEGNATGETFNYLGKTDIIVKHKGSNLFIAECKIWSGEKALSEAIDQLLNYVTWRDTKTALIIFNRNKNFSDILTKIHAAVQGHTNYVRDESQQSETERRYVFRNKNDANRQFLLTTMAFNVPVGIKIRN
jgi:hypothetical protein